MRKERDRLAERATLKEVAGLDESLLKPSYVGEKKLAQLFYRASEYNRACRMRARSAILAAFAGAATVATMAMSAPEYGVSAFALTLAAGALCAVSHSSANLNRRRLQMMSEEIKDFDILVQQGRQERGQSPAPAL